MSGPALGCAAGEEGVPTSGASGGGFGEGGDGTPGSSTTAGASTASTASTTTTGGTGQGGTGQGGAGQGGTGQGGDGQGGDGQGGDGLGGTGQGGGGGASQGSGGEGGGTGTGGAEPESGVLTLLATGAAGAYRAAREDGVWVASAIGGTFAAGSRPAIAMRSAGAAIGLARALDDELRQTRWNGSTWTAFAAVGDAITTGDTPALASGGDGLAHAVFHGALTDFHYYARFDGSAWSPDDELVSANDVDSFGPSPAAIAVVDGDPLIVYAGNDDNLYVQERSAGTWSAGIDVSGTASVDVTPAVAALAAGADGDALIVFVAVSDGTLRWTRRVSGDWSAPASIAQALTNEAPTVAATAEGGAVVAFRGTNGGVYAAVFDGDGGSWSAPERVVPVVTTLSTPAVATGIGPAAADLVYVDAATGDVAHVRLLGDRWSDVSVVGGTALTAVALASSP